MPTDNEGIIYPRAKAQTKGKRLIASMDSFAGELLKHAKIAESLVVKNCGGRVGIQLDSDQGP